MKKKSTYIILCVCLGLFGIHKFYLEDYAKGFLYIPTAGLLTIGWIRDMFHMSGDVDRYNAKRGYLDTRARG